MDVTSQRSTLDDRPLGKAERARFFVSERHGGLECLEATFRTHVYAPHAHETFVVGTVVAGCETFLCRGARHYVGPDDLTFVNPLEVHDGEPFEDGYSYRMSYPTVDFVAAAAREVAGEASARMPYFAQPCVRDPEGAALFVQAHRLLDQGEDALAGDEALLGVMALLVARHGGVRPRSLGQEAAPVKRAQALIDDRFADDLSLDDLAAAAGLPRHLLIRAFRRETGATPHSYLVNRRVLEARSLLRSGVSPAEAALAVGFFDQSHLTRAFKARHGVTPGAYRAAFRH
ncbi:AraC family transcriptional regulator [uncultured Alsobacter sp.]|uniref:AraC family transcriptional regulator n=1 Tax=uncultured Alsobacter sp. TaxID=1748258 RepID=UPI0025F7C5CC|nr:AraC family transcriptional regulator [uncultured Alsobacter sp.]